MKKSSIGSKKIALRTARRRKSEIKTDNFDDNIRRGEREHDRRDKLIEHWGGIVVNFSQGAMRAPALASAGGIAATLGFLSANYSRLNKYNSLVLIDDILFWLFLSALCSVIAPGFAYFSQFFYARSLSVKEYMWEYPFIINKNMNNFFQIAGDIFRYLTYLVVIASVFFLGYGGFKLLDLLKTLQP